MRRSIGVAPGARGARDRRCTLRSDAMENDVIEITEQAADQAADTPSGVIEELLVEEISIDGMCGVY